MIHSRLYHLVWVLSGKCYIPWKCRTILQTLLKRCIFLCISSFVFTGQKAKGIFPYFLNVHITGYCWLSKIALLLFPSHSHDIFFLPLLKWNATVLLLFCSEHKDLQSLWIKVSNKSGQVVCYCVTWPLPVIKVAHYRYRFVFEPCIQSDDTYLNQSPSCFAAMKLSPGKAQTEKVKPHVLTLNRI